MRYGSLPKYAACTILAAGIGYFVGRRDPSSTARTVSAAQSVHPLLMPAQSTTALVKQTEAWAGDAASLKVQGPLPAQLERAFRLHDPFRQSLAVQLLGHLKASEAPDVFNLLKAKRELANTTGNNGPPIWQAFWMAWGAVDAEAALAQIKAGLPRYPVSDRAAKEVFAGLAMRNPQKAAALAESRVENEERMWAVEGTAYRWAAEDPTAATQWAMTRLDGAFRDWAFKAIPFGIVQHQNFAEALDWWAKVPAGGGAEKAFGTLVEISTDWSPVTAADRVALLRRASERELRSPQLEMMVANDYASADPLAGVAALGSLPPATVGEPYRPVSALVRTWAQNDPEAAGTWLLQQPADAWGGAAIRGYISAIKRDNPEAAARWEETLKSSTAQ
jgi:hypothetical protein